MLGISLGLTARLNSSASSTFDPTTLFGLTDTGWFYDHSDFSTMFQDAAGTIPVTDVGQPVGRQLDKSGPGWRRTQPIALNRPILGRHPFGGIRNLLTRTEEFENLAWVKQPVTTIAPNVAMDPDGTMTADRVVNLDATVGDRVTQNITIANQTLTGSIWLRGEGSDIGKNVEIAAKRVGGSYAGASIIHTLTSEWVRVNVSFAQIAGNTGAGLNITSPSSNSATNVLIWGAQLEPGSTATPYQRVGSQFDVTEAGVPDLHYLSYDGINDSMATASFAWGTDKATVVAGVRKLSDAAGARTIIETSTNSDSTNGTFRLGTDAATFTWRSRGTVSVDTSGAGVQPITTVLTGIGDIAGDVARLRQNALQVGEVLKDQGTGNFLTYPAYFGARAGTSSFFNGREYSQFAINRLLTAQELSDIEAYTNGKTGAY